VAYARGAGRQQVPRSAHGYEGPHEGRTTADLHEPPGDGEGVRERPLADALCGRCGGWAHEQRQQATQRVRACEDRQALADTEEQPVWTGLCASEQTGKRGRRPCDGGSEGPAGWWELEPDVGRVADGVASRVDRLRTIGNGWVPQVAAVVAGRIARRLT
jgi:DNA (cytosine-5)-methyltransferase 1